MIRSNRWLSSGTVWENVDYHEDFTWEGERVNSYIRATTMGIATMLKDAKNNGYKSEYWHSNNDYDYGYDSGKHWDLGLGATKSLQMATEGWPNKAQYIQKLADKCADLTLEMPTQQIVRDVTGPIWDMPAVIEGQPYCALNFREAPSPELIKLCINGFYSCSVDADALEKRAAAMAALVMTLHTAGYAVECTVIMPAVLHKYRALSEVVIHTPGEVFDLERIAFWMGHPAAIRNVLYGAEGVFGHNNHGGSILDEGLTKALKKKAQRDGAIYIDSMYSGEGGNQDSIRACSTEEGSLKWIRQQVENVKKWSLGNLEEIPQEQGVA